MVQKSNTKTDKSEVVKGENKEKKSIKKVEDEKVVTEKKVTLLKKKSIEKKSEVENKVKEKGKTDEPKKKSAEKKESLGGGGEGKKKEKEDKKKGGGAEAKKVEEVLYTIPLRKAFRAPRTKRANKAVKIVKSFLARHTKAKEVKVDEKLNEEIWRRGIEKPPRRIKVKALKEIETGFVTATTA